MKKLLISIFALLLVCTLTNCTHKQAQTEEPEQAITGQDSSTVKQLAVDYLEALKAKDYESALGMLYIQRNDSLLPLDEQAAQRVAQQSQMFPVLKYRISDIEFVDSVSAEVFYVIEFFEKPEGDSRPNTMRFGLKPVKVGSEW